MDLLITVSASLSLAVQGATAVNEPTTSTSTLNSAKKSLPEALFKALDNLYGGEQHRQEIHLRALKKALGEHQHALPSSLSSALSLLANLPHAATASSVTEDEDKEIPPLGGVFVVNGSSMEPVYLKIRVACWPSEKTEGQIILAFPNIWKWAQNVRDSLEKAIGHGLRLAKQESSIAVAYFCPSRSYDAADFGNVTDAGSLQLALTLAAYGSATKQHLADTHPSFVFTGKVNVSSGQVEDVKNVGVKTGGKVAQYVIPQANKEALSPLSGSDVHRVSHLYQAIRLLGWKRPLAHYLEPLATSSKIEDVISGDRLREQDLFPMRIYSLPEQTSTDITQQSRSLQFEPQSREQPKEIEHKAFLQSSGLVVLVSDPNNGKSTLLRYYEHLLAKEALDSDDPNARLPVWLDLVECANFQKQGFSWKKTFCFKIGEKMGTSWEALASEQSRMVLLLDGWDRLRDEESVSGLKDWMQGEQKPCLIVLASRLGLEPKKKVPSYLLDSLELSDVKKLLSSNSHLLPRQEEEFLKSRKSPLNNRMFFRVFSNLPNLFSSKEHLICHLMDRALHLLLERGLEKVRSMQKERSPVPDALLAMMNGGATDKRIISRLLPALYALANAARTNGGYIFQENEVRSSLAQWLNSAGQLKW